LGTPPASVGPLVLEQEFHPTDDRLTQVFLASRRDGVRFRTLGREGRVLHRLGIGGKAGGNGLIGPCRRAHPQQRKADRRDKQPSPVHVRSLQNLVRRLSPRSHVPPRGCSVLVRLRLLFLVVPLILLLRLILVAFLLGL